MRTALLWASFIAFTACTGNDKGADTSETGETGGVDSATAAELLTAMNGYESWGTVNTDWEGIVASDDGTHGAFVQVWYNQTSLDFLATASGGEMAYDSIIVKQGYDDAGGTGLKNLTAMWKKEGYSSDGEWFWAQWNASGDLMQAGEPSGCVGCHSSGQDYNRIATW